MKKWIGIAIVSIVLIVGLTKVDWNRIGKDTLFVEIKGATDIEETTLENGEVMKRYVYTQPAFTSEGSRRKSPLRLRKSFGKGPTYVYTSRMGTQSRRMRKCPVRTYRDRLPKSK